MTFATMPTELYLVIGLFLAAVFVILGEAAATWWTRRTNRARAQLAARPPVDQWGDLIDQATDWSPFDDRRAA